MGYSGFNIAGHSGTSFKHRKAYQAIKKYDKKGSSHVTEFVEYNSSKFEKVTSDPISIGDSKLMDRVRFKASTLMILGLIGLLYILINGMTETPWSSWNNSRKQTAQLKQRHYNKERENGYHVLVSTGMSYYERGQFDKAQSEFTRALNLDEYGMEARIGLYKVLDQKCCESGLYCTVVEEYKVFIEQMGYSIE